MKTQEIERFRYELEAFLSDLVPHMGRKERQFWANVYIRGLLSDGERKSVEPMARRLTDGDVQGLQQFLNQSPWPYEPLRASLARKMEEEFAPEAYWLIDDVSFPKQGDHSVGVARQYCGALGKVANCQVAVSLDLGTEVSSTPLNWALYLPQDWTEDPDRRKQAGIPEGYSHHTKPELALALIDQVRKWGLQDRLVLADSGYGGGDDFRYGLRERGLNYVVQVDGDMTAWTEDPHPPKLPMMRRGKIRRKTYYPEDLPPTRTVEEIALDLPSERWKKITWREGTKGPLASRFARVVVWPAHRLIRGKALRVNPEEVLVQWPEDKKSPTKYWLSSLAPKKTSFRGLVRKAKGRFRVEQDYREMKMEVGLDHFEGRSWQGWHHHVTLVSLAYSFLTLMRLGNKKNFWVDIASCPPLDPEISSPIHRDLPHM